MPYKFVFLIYLARSGSTFLASELDKYHDVGVTIEENIPDGIKKGNRVIIRNEKEADQYLNQIYKDEKFKAWGIDKDKLRETLLEKLEFPFTFRDILPVIHYHYFSGVEPCIVFHKQGNYCLKINKVKKEFPDAGFLFIDRDPRAIYNSQQRNINSLTHKPMSTNVVKFSLVCKRVSQLARSYNEKSFFHTLNYEELINEPNEMIKNVLTSLGLNHIEKDDTKEYYSKIPDSQKGIHENILRNPDRTNIDKWQEELQSENIAFLQFALKKEIIKKGYPLKKKIYLTFWEKLRVMIWILWFSILYGLLRIFNWRYFSIRKLQFVSFG